jgi:hypothetical protein
MANIIRYILDDALSLRECPEMCELILDTFGRPQTLQEMEHNIGNMHDSVRQYAFTSLANYKKHMTGGNECVEAAYNQIIKLFYDALEHKNDQHHAVMTGPASAAAKTVSMDVRLGGI